MIRIAPIDTAVERRVQARGRRFLWAWLAASTSFSFLGNLAHAYLQTARDAHGVPFPLAVAWAAAPPLLLMLAIHAVPVIVEMLEDTAAVDRLLTRVVWGVVAGAFGWSAVGIFSFTVSTGVPAPLAVLAPIVIDLSVFGATRSLVRTAPIAARLRLEAVPSRVAAPRRAAAPAPVKAASTPAVSADAPAPRPASKPTPAPLPPAIDTQAAAARIAAAGVVRQEVDTIAAILTASAAGNARQRIADDLRIHHSVVRKVLAAAAEPVTTPALAAVR